MDLTEEAVTTVERIVAKAHGAEMRSLRGPDEEGGIQIIAVQPNVSLKSIKPFLDEYLKAPDRRTGTARLLTLESFIEHALRHKDADSVVFANNDVKAPSLTCVYDYNLQGPSRDSLGAAKSVARFGTHRASYAFPLSEEWKAWTAKDGQPMAQAEFAAFLEDRIADVAEPLTEKMGATARDFFQRVGVGVQVATPQRLLALSREFSVHSEENVRQAVNLQTGETVVQYEAKHVDEQAAPVKVPGAFLLALPVFKAGAPYEVAARLRYRVSAGRITWFYTLYRIDLIFDHAFTEAFTRVEEETGLPLFQGSPEA